MIKVDYSELKNYSEWLTAMGDGFSDFLRDFLLECAERVISQAKPKTPVDTGALRRSWTLGSVGGDGFNIYVEIQNPMEYATFIENGHRIVNGRGDEVGWYEGRFMLKTSIENVQRAMPRQYEQKFKAFCMLHGIA